MKNTTSHPRMYAFFRSKVLNSLMILMIVCLFMMTYTGFMLMPSVCGSLALLLLHHMPYGSGSGNLKALSSTAGSLI